MEEPGRKEEDEVVDKFLRQATTQLLPFFPLDKGDDEYDEYAWSTGFLICKDDGLMACKLQHSSSLRFNVSLTRQIYSFSI